MEKPESVPNQNNPILPKSSEESFAPDLGLSADDLIQIKEDAEKSKKRIGYFLLFLLTISLIIVQALNSAYFRSLSLAIWSALIYGLFLFVVLIAKFDLIDKIVSKSFPYLKEPADFLNKLKERNE